jgi:hypothetical protein
MPFQFNPPDGFKNKTAFPTTPASEDEFRAQMWAPFEQVRDYINQHLPTLDTPSMGLYRNAIINGNFDVWQRGTSFSNPMSGTYTADRWINLYDGTGQQHTISRQSFIPGQTDVPNNPSYFVRVSVTSAASGQTFNVLHQRIESVRTFAGKTVTISFWAKADAARTLAAKFFQNFGSGGSSVVGISGESFNLTTNWQKFSCTVTIPSISGKVIGPGDNLGVEFFFPVGETFVIDIAQVQLNEGNVALPYQPRSFAEELALCQRYFEKSYDINTAPGSTNINGMIQFNSGVPTINPIYIPVQFKVAKRIAPTVTLYDGAGAPGMVYKGGNGKTASLSRVGVSGFVGGTADSTNSSDLVFHYTADAEL